MYYSPAAAENCIRGFFHLGFQASYAQVGGRTHQSCPASDVHRNPAIPVSRILKTEVLPTSTALVSLSTGMNRFVFMPCLDVSANISQDLAKHFLPYRAISTKICRDVPSGVSKEVGFARYSILLQHRKFPI